MKPTVVAVLLGLLANVGSGQVLFHDDPSGPSVEEADPLQIIYGPVTNAANGHAYYLLGNSTWTEAEAQAVALGGHLVTINNAEENSWVVNTFSSYGGVHRSLWIGLNDAQQEGTFVWQSGEPVTYTNWRTGEPNGSAGAGEDYTYIYGVIPGYNLVGQWNDVSNFSTPGGLEPPFHGVVEVVLPPPPPPLPPPVITDFSPKAGEGGNVVTVLGTNFSDVAASNVVYFGAVRAEVTAATSTALTVTVPAGATFATPSVTVGGLTAYAATPFVPTYPGGSNLAPSNFAPRFNLPTGSGPHQTTIADLDGDGKTDIVIADSLSHTISIYRNTSAGGALSAASFEPRIILPTDTADHSPYYIKAGDVDGDGRLDLVAVSFGGNIAFVYRSIAQPGILTSNSFAPRVSFAIGSGPQDLSIVDVDGDGRPEIVTANYRSSNVSVLRNTSMIGNIGFAPRVDLPAGNGADSVAVADLDGDGKPDLAVANVGANSVSLLRNTSTPGVIASNSFSPAVHLTGPNYPHYIRAVDLDGDGKLDLALTSYLGQSLSIFRNQASLGVLGVGSFAARVDFSVGGRGHSLDIGDLNGDLKPDVVVSTELPSHISLFQNVGTPGAFTTNSFRPRVDLASGFNAFGASVGDLDGDGRPDIIAANTSDANVSVYQNLSRINHPPLADAGATEMLLISPNGLNAVAVLDGSLSSDLDGDALSYSWFRTGEVSPFATGVVAITSLPLGMNELTLVVDDGLATGSQDFSVEVITTSEAVERLAQLVEADAERPQPLLASLRAALASIDRSQPEVAINQLEAFMNKVQAQVMPLDAELAGQLLADAQAIIDALNGGGATAEVPLEITSIEIGNGGKPKLNIRGRGNRLQVVEMSTNMIDWVPVGVAKKCGDIDFEFEDATGAVGAVRYYRVVSPK